jgi:flagellar protein FlgJ
MNSIAATHAGAGAGSAAAACPRLVRAAHQFEAQMMKELMEPMTRGSSMIGDEDGSISSSGSGGALTEFASEALGQALSERGGFGIASQIVRHLAQSGNQATSGTVTASQHSNTVLRASK